MELSQEQESGWRADLDVMTIGRGPKGNRRGTERNR